MRALAPLPVAAVLACGALAGCGGAAAANGGPVCADTGHVNGLAIRRIDTIPQYHRIYTFPARTSATSAGQAQDVAHSLCELPDLPSGGYACPEDAGVSYRLTFRASDRKLPPVTADATGCQEVSGVGPVRWTASSPDFWKTLAEAARITPARHSAFAGSMT
jgi:hypothetical protein